MTDWMRFVVHLVRWEGRAHGRGFLLLMGAVSLGVAALVAVRSLQRDLEHAIADQGRVLLGADMVFRRTEPFSERAQRVLERLESRGVAFSRVTRFASLARVARTDASRLVQLRAIESGYPFYGDLTTQPDSIWPTMQEERRIVVDPALLAQLEAAVGDSVDLGAARFEIAGVVTTAPGSDVGLQATLAPRVYIGAAFLEETELITDNSFVTYESFVRLPEGWSARRVLNRYRRFFRRERITVRTAQGIEGSLTTALANGARYLGLVGLLALFFGGTGVASAVHLFVGRKLNDAAILRCLGAARSQVLAIYLILAASMAVAGAVIGAALGIGLQHAAATLVDEFLPVRLERTISWRAVWTGVGLGAWIAVLFSALPLLQLRKVSPLLTLRRHVDPRVQRLMRWDPYRLMAYGAIAMTFFVLTATQLRSVREGLAFAAGVVASAAVLWGVARILIALARRVALGQRRYTVRQGLANLYRPGNQTQTVILALGFGVFFIATVYVLQYNLLREFSVENDPTRPNVVFFDIQPDQVAGTTQLIEAEGHAVRTLFPVVTLRIAKLNGRTARQALADPHGPRPARWAVRREYRVTYRDSLGPAERVTEGAWWSGPLPADAMPQVSLDEDIAQVLGVGLNSRMTFDVQGVEMETLVTSLREVNFARLEPNFFIVFRPGPLDDVPRMYVLLTQVRDDDARGRLQRLVAERYANVAAVDLTLLLRTFERIFDRVQAGIRFLAFFTIGTGLLVLVGAVVTSKLQRMRESALLKTLGATARQIRGILVTEYAALGLFGALTGSLLAIVASGLLCRYYLDIPFTVPVATLASWTAGLSFATAALGWSGSREVFGQTPLTVLRAE